MNQEDIDNDDRGDVCDNEFTFTATLNGTLANVCFYYSNGSQSYNVIKPDCFNTVFTCTYKDTSGNTVIITPIDRIRQAYWIPQEELIKDVNDPAGESDVAKLLPGEHYCFSCNLFEQFDLEDLSSKGTVECSATYANYIEDPNGVVDLMTGAVSSNVIQFIFQNVKVDLEPTLNLLNLGVTPVVIFGDANFKPKQDLIISSVTLTGNYSNNPIPTGGTSSCLDKYSYSDLNGDTYTDIKLFYRTSCLRNYLDTKDTVIYLNGTTKNGTTIWGSDTVSIIK